MKCLITDIVQDTYTNASGFSLYTLIKKNLDSGIVTEISFKEASPLSSSFLNSSLGAIIEEIGFSNFKEKIKLIELSKTQANHLLSYFKACGCIA
jgi:hypothetical protein